MYAPDPGAAADAGWPTVDWQLSLTPVRAASIIDSMRIAVRPVAGELQVYKGACWAKTPPLMLEDALLRTLEDYGLIAAVATQGAGVAADCKLVMDLRRFEAGYAGNALPAATMEVNAKLLHAIDQTSSPRVPSCRPNRPRAPTWSRCRTPSRAASASSVLVPGQAHDGAKHPVASRRDR